jgi:hypothetical protein
MAYMLRIYMHRSTRRDRNAAETVAGVLLEAGWMCVQCGGAYIGIPHESGLCDACEGS